MIYLASQSPRRAQLLQQIGVEFQVINSDIDETPQLVEAAGDYVQRMAFEKAMAGQLYVDLNQLPKQWILAADTTVVYDGEILGKPDNKDDARRMLKRLSGQTHQVMTAISLYDGERAHTQRATTLVTFGQLTAAMIDNYIVSGEPMDKAGSYGIQGLGAMLVERIDGDYHTVVGLPVKLVADLMRKLGSKELLV